MVRTYFNQAFHLIRQNPLFSGFYILGTGLAISMVMLLVVIYYIKVAGIYPETNRARMMVISDVHMQSVDNSNSNSTGLIAYNIVKDLFYNLKGTEAVSAIGTYVAGDGYAQLPSSKHRIPVVQKAVDVAFWKVFDFDFVDGAPFSESDFASGIHHIVISEEVAQRIFNTSKVVGKYLTIDFVEYKICGVVKTPSYATELSYAQVWIPYTCFPGYDKYNQYDALGAYEVVILARSSSDFDSIKAQVDEFTRKFNAISHDGYKLLWHGQPYAYWKTLFRVDSMTDLDFMKIFRQIGAVLLMLLLVPALNLSGMISGRMEKRLPEIGVRKAFGATSCVLFSQIIWENLILTVIGGCLGLIISYGMVLLYKNWLLTLLDDNVTALPDGVGVSITPQMLFSPVLFMAVFLICVMINLFSAVIPAYLSLRKDIVYSINKQK